MTKRTIVIVLFCCCCALPFEAEAHAFGSRYDLPLPLSFYLYAAGTAVAVSFVGAFFIFTPGMKARHQVQFVLPDAFLKFVRSGLAALGLMLFALVLATALIGPSSPTKNFSTVFVWVLWWVGFVLFSSLIINLWAEINPFRSLANLVDKLRATKRVLPDQAGWIATLGLLAISWLELVSEKSEDPIAMFYIILLYLFLTLGGALIFGAAAWFEKCDPVSRLFTNVGKIAPFALDKEKGVFTARLPASGLVGAQAKLPGAGSFILCLIAIVMFDGLSETPVWQSILEFVTQSRTLRPWLLDIRAAGVDILQLLQTLGLFTLVLLTVFSYRILVVFMWLSSGRQETLSDIAKVFVASILPIVIAYHLAHYVSYLMLAGQLIIPIINDPFAFGWDLFGIGTHRIDLGVINAEDVWWVAITAIITGHILSVFVAHAEAVKFFKSRKQAILSQLPMAIFMICLTMGSLWILSQPIVE